MASRCWNVTGQPKGQIQELINFSTLVRKNADASSRSNARVYSFHSLKPYCSPLEQMHTGPTRTV